MKFQAASHLQEFLDHEFAWRLKEISDMKMAARLAAAQTRRTTIIRAGIPLLYAHWEGFVKMSFEAYVSYVANKRLPLAELTDNFVFLCVKNHIQTLTASRKAKANIEAVHFLRTKMGTRPHISTGSSIDTESNLNSEVFQNIALTAGIDCRKYESRYNFIDVELLKNRNEIAHGHYLSIDPEAYATFSDEVITLLRWVKTDIENCITTECFKLARMEQ